MRLSYRAAKDAGVLDAEALARHHRDEKTVSPAQESGVQADVRFLQALLLLLALTTCAIGAAAVLAMP